MKVAIVHDYFYQYGGGEKVVEEWLYMYPEADVFTSFYQIEQFRTSPALSKALEKNKVTTAPFLQKYFSKPGRVDNFKYLFWLYPLLMSLVTVKKYDVVLISSSFCAKNIRLKQNTKIIHYCHSPTRFLYMLDLERELPTLDFLKTKLLSFCVWWLQILDRRASKNLSKKNALWITNSRFTATNILTHYRVNPNVLHPPVQLHTFNNIQKNEIVSAPFYLYYGRVSFHKKLDHTIKACLETNTRLVIIGSAVHKDELVDLQNIANYHYIRHPETRGLIKFKGWQDYSAIQVYLTTCRACIFAGVEDFGITQVEVLASGTPIVGINQGGHREYLQDGLNSILYDNQSIKSLVQAIQREKEIHWDPTTIKKTAQLFSSENFHKQMNNLVYGSE
jgi:glycosyltransferase involved in cell wall biosynthesis